MNRKALKINSWSICGCKLFVPTFVVVILACGFLSYSALAMTADHDCNDNSFVPDELDREVLVRNLLTICTSIKQQLDDRNIDINNVDLLFPGRSLPLIQAGFELMYPDVSTIPFPISNFRVHYRTDSVMTRALNDNVFSHFHEYIGIDNIGNRPAVVLDYGGGRSLSSVVDFTNGWLASNGRTHRAIGVLFHPTSSSNLQDSVNGASFIHQELDDSNFIRYFHEEIFDDLAPMISFDLNSRPQNPLQAIAQKKQRYEQFKQYVKLQVLDSYLKAPSQHELSGSCNSNSLDPYYDPDNDGPPGLSGPDVGGSAGCFGGLLNIFSGCCK